MRIFFCLLFSLLSFSAFSQQAIGLIPMPNKIAIGEGFFQLNNATTISFKNEECGSIAYYFQNEILKQKGLTIQHKNSETGIILHLTEDKKKRVDDAYSLSIKTNKIVISASSKSGLFYGVISLLQMSSVSKSDQISVCEISDAPAYAWRGFMLDESRHFFGKQKVKSILNWMAFYKLNTFHWHLTDEPAWRFEVKKYPKLGLIGGIGDYINPNLSAQYYTQEEIKEIIAYAADRFIKVIPEIDMPGHATAANRAYPEYSGGGSKDHPEFTFNPGKEGTYSYLTDILKETNVLFPSGMMHLGGDEVGFGNVKWKTDSAVLNLKQRENLKDEIAVEHYFMKRMADSVFSLNAKVVAWDELADADLPIDKTILFWWRQEKPTQLRTSLSKGYQTVICPRIPLYFDFVQDSTHINGRRWTKAFSPIESVYNFDANSYALNVKESNLILGIQANLWTETIDTEQRMDYMVFPRIAALSEAAWTKQSNKDYRKFNNNLEKHLMLYNTAGLYFFNPFKPSQNPEIQSKKKVQISADLKK